MDITLILIGIILLALGFGLAYLPAIKTLLTEKQWQSLCNLAYIGVTAIQQIYKDHTGQDIGQVKYQEVKEWLLSKNLKYSEEDIEKAIEAAYIRFKKELESSQ